MRSSNMTLSDRELLAKTLQAEAGNQGIGGMLAVGSVIRNRMAQGGSLSDVILAPAQFSAWNKVTGAVGGEQGQDMAALKPSEDAYAAADAILSGNAPDVTGGATHYYNPSISNPAWGKEKAGGDWTKIGAHIFGKAGDFRTGAAKMNGEQTQKPQGLLGGLLGGQGIGGALGMSDDFRDRLKMAILAGTGDARMDPLIRATAARMEERRDEAKELKRRNKSLDYLTKKADAGDDLAAQYLGVISTGAVDAGSGLASYLKASTATDSSSSAFGEKFNIYKKAMPDASDMQILEKMNEKDLPATFEALDMTARAAGFKPKTEGGDGQYEEFMAGQGAGFKRAAQNLADMNFEQLQEYTKTLGKADRTTKLIDQIKSSQYLDGVLGRVEGKIPVSSWLSLGVFDQDETDLIQLIDNLENSVFLEAFQELKGGGQITELEGEKAQRAIVNLNRDRSKKAFLDALDTLQSVIDAGVGRAKRGVSVNNPYTKDLVVGGNGGSAKPAASGEQGAANQPVVIDGYSIVKVE